MRSLWADLRTAARALRSTPGPSATAVLALSLGVATAVTLYTAFRAISDDLPPVPHPERLGRLYAEDPAMPMGWRPLSAREVAPLVEQAGGRLVAALVDDADVTLEIAGCAAVERAHAQPVGPSFFEVAGVLPQRGRIWTADELADHSPLLLGADLWRRACGGAPDIVGRTAHVDGRPHEVAGVMPDGFWLTDRDAALWLPLVAGAGRGVDGRGQAEGSGHVGGRERALRRRRLARARAGDRLHGSPDSADTDRAGRACSVPRCSC